jgi:DNA segregation ATPase FtsK/SpoIIIE, S-DNA-T family
MPGDFIMTNTVKLTKLLESKVYTESEYKLPVVLGEDTKHNPVVIDLSQTPHLLMAGTTGSGKSVAMNVMILSLINKLTPDECRFVMIDPKMLDLTVYNNLPHMLTPVITDTPKALKVLEWVVEEMMTRYHLLNETHVKSVDSYNKKSNKKLPNIVVCIDELADLMLTSGKKIESFLQRIAQMGRAAGIHLIVATQRPSVDVITGTIKANFPARMSFQVASKFDSRTVLGEDGAEELLGKGDMYYKQNNETARVQGAYVTDDEINEYIKEAQEAAET